VKTERLWRRLKKGENKDARAEGYGKVSSRHMCRGKTSGSGYEHIRFKDIILKFNNYADAIKYAQKMRKNVCPLHIGR